jgi:hypothetical protein
MRRPNGTTQMFIGGLVLLLVFATELRRALGDERPTNPDIGPNTVELLSYQASGYKYLIVRPGETLPSGFEQRDFDDTDFLSGNAAFGSILSTGGSCPLQVRVQTDWPVLETDPNLPAEQVRSRLLVRRFIDIPAGVTDVRVMVSVDNDIIRVFFNGTPISGFVPHDFCPVEDEFRFDVPPELVQPGLNLVAFHVLDRGVESFFDTRILATQTTPPGVSQPLPLLPPLQVTHRLYIDEKDTPGLASADRQLVLNAVLDNPGPTAQTLVHCPMLHVHDPGEPALDGQILAITAEGGQRVSVEQDTGDGPGVYRHPRSFRFPFPLPTPFTVGPNTQALITYSAKLSELIPTLEPFTRAEIKSKILAHAMAVSSTMYNDYFFNFNLEPGDVFQCPHGPNTWWKFGIDDPDDFSAGFGWFDFTFTNVFSTRSVPITIHTSETAGALLGGTPLSAFIEVIPRCFSVECPSTPGMEGTSGQSAVVWTTDPAPGEVFVIDEPEKVGTMVLDVPSEQLPEGAVMHFTVIMREAASGRILSIETKRFAQDTQPPAILAFDFAEDGEGHLLASATVLDEAASIDFVELLVSLDGGQSFAGFPMEWQSGDFLTPTLFEATFGPLRPGRTIFKIRAVDEAGNSSETPPHEVEVPIIIE